MSPKEEKVKVFLLFDEDVLLKVRKILFQKETTMHQFVNFIFHRLILGDENATNLLQGAISLNLKALEQGDLSRANKISHASLYEMFEREDTERNTLNHSSLAPDDSNPETTKTENR